MEPVETWKKEVLSPHHPYEPLPDDDTCRRGQHRDRERALSVRVGASDQRVAFVAKTEESGVVHPVLQHEFELTFDVRVQTHEKQSARLAVVFRDAVAEPLAVRTAAAKDAMPIPLDRGVRNDVVVEERIARVGAADVRADRAAVP